VGPYKVTEVITTGNVVRLMLPASMRIYNVFNISDLKLYVAKADETPEMPSDDPFDSEEI
jgi:hypothetical protein